MEYVGGGGDGIAAEEQRTSRPLAGGYEAPCRGGVAVDVGIDTRLGLARLDATHRDRGVDIVAVVIAGAYHLGVGLEDGGFLGKLAVKHVDGGLEGTVEQPAHQTQGEYVAALEHALVVHARVGQRGLGHRGDGHLDYLGVDVELLERLEGLEESLLEVGLLERVDVDDGHTAGAQETHVLLERRRVHGHEHVAHVTGSVDIGAHAHLESRHAAKRPLRGAHLGRIVGES